MSSRGVWLRFLCHQSRGCVDKLGARETSKRFWSAARVSAAAARQELNGVAASFREALSSELQSAALAVTAGAAGSAEWSLPYVIHWCRGKGKTHVVANRALKMLPVFEWKAACG